MLPLHAHGSHSDPCPTRHIRQAATVPGKVMELASVPVRANHHTVGVTDNTVATDLFHPVDDQTGLSVSPYGAVRGARRCDGENHTPSPCRARERLEQLHLTMIHTYPHTATPHLTSPSPRRPRFEVSVENQRRNNARHLFCPVLWCCGPCGDLALEGVRTSMVLVL